MPCAGCLRTEHLADRRAHREATSSTCSTLFAPPRSTCTNPHAGRPGSGTPGPDVFRCTSAATRRRARLGPAASRRYLRCSSPDSSCAGFARRLVDVDYRVAMGGQAYGTFARSLQRGTPAPVRLRCSAELAAKFQPLVDALGQVSDAAYVYTQRDILQTVRSLAGDGSVRARRLLRRLGVEAAHGCIRECTSRIGSRCCKRCRACSRACTMCPLTHDVYEFLIDDRAGCRRRCERTIRTEQVLVAEDDGTLCGGQPVS